MAAKAAFGGTFLVAAGGIGLREQGEAVKNLTNVKFVMVVRFFCIAGWEAR